MRCRQSTHGGTSVRRARLTDTGPHGQGGAHHGWQQRHRKGHCARARQEGRSRDSDITRQGSATASWLLIVLLEPHLCAISRDSDECDAPRGRESGANLCCVKAARASIIRHCVWQSRGADAVADIIQRTNNRKTEFMQLELDSLQAVKSFTVSRAAVTGPGGQVCETGAVCSSTAFFALAGCILKKEPLAERARAQRWCDGWGVRRHEGWNREAGTYPPPLPPLRRTPPRGQAALRPRASQRQ